MNNYVTASLSAFLLLVSSASAFQTSSSEILDFSGWDHSAITSGGQMFENVCGNVDVMVTANGDFEAPSEFHSTLTGSVSSIQTQLIPVGSQSYTFEFSEPISLVLDMDLLDTYESLAITTDGSASYNHGGGSMPMLTPIDDGLMLQGTAVGMGSDGAAYGNIPLGDTSQVTMTYSALPSSFTKYGAFSLGKIAVVPEPASFGLFWIGLIGLFGFGRRSRK